MIITDFLYSPTLLLAMICAGVFAVLSISWYIKSRRGQQQSKLPLHWMKRLAIGGILLAAGSVFIHFFGDHAPGSADGMGYFTFLRAHPAFLMLVFVLATEWVWLKQISK